MTNCQIRPEEINPLTSTPFLLVMSLIWLDLTLTITNIILERGTEANPFFAWFTQQGEIPMIVGSIIYITIVVVWFLNMPLWIRSITVGFLASIHIWGSLSWLRILFDSFTIFFDVFWMTIGLAMFGALLTFWTYVDLKTCPFPGQEKEILVFYR